MKYKIGNVEVEAVQWDGGVFLSKIASFLNNNKLNCCVMRNQDNSISISDTVDNINEGEYIIKSNKSLFILAEQDFNNMATKVKEPKFKVGDVVYFCNNQDHLECRKVSIISAHPEKNIISYYIKFKDGSCAVYNECFLFTKEEAIEKLKEL